MRLSEAEGLESLVIDSEVKEQHKETWVDP